MNRVKVRTASLAVLAALSVAPVSRADFIIYYDIKYVRHMSFLVDLKILIATVLTLGGKSHVPLSWIISSHSQEHA